MSSSFCGSKCGCGSSSNSGCKCGSGCGGCKMFPNVVTENAATAAKQPLISGVASTGKVISEGSENSGGCTQCGVLCDCQPCLCKKLRG